MPKKDPQFKKEAIGLSLVAVLYVALFVGLPMYIGYTFISAMSFGYMLLCLFVITALVRLFTFWFEYQVVSYYCICAAIMAALIGILAG